MGGLLGASLKAFFSPKSSRSPHTLKTSGGLPRCTVKKCDRGSVGVGKKKSKKEERRGGEEEEEGQMGEKTVP